MGKREANADAPARKLRIVVLAEGDAETWDSWSGTSQSVVSGLRKLGHEVKCVDADLYGIPRLACILREFSPQRRRWWIKYHLNCRPFLQRSRRANSAVSELGKDVDVLLQFGATFLPAAADKLPLFLYCDGNIALSRLAVSGGQSEASFLTESEITGVHAREASVYSKASHIFTISDRLRSSFVSDFGVADDGVTTVFAGSNLPTVAGTSLTPIDERPETPSILFVGRDFQRKGGDVLLEAFARVRRELPTAELRVVGPQQEFSEPGVVGFGLLDMEDPGDLALVQRLYRESHVFCMPTRFEPFGISFLEAMSYGLPCIGTRTKWSRLEMIVHEETGLVVELDDSAALAQALLALLKDPVRAAAMGAAGRKRVESHFTWASVCQRMSTVMQEHVHGT